MLWICCHGGLTILLTHLSENEFFQPAPWLTPFVGCNSIRKCQSPAHSVILSLTGGVESQTWEKRQRFYRNKRDQSSSLKCQVCLRNKVLFFNSSPCFLFFVIYVTPRVYPLPTGEQMRLKMLERGQGVSGHAAWRRTARLHRTNRRGNLYETGDVHSKSHATRHASDSEQGEFVSPGKEEERGKGDTCM